MVFILKYYKIIFYMSFTSNSWKKSGGINRNKYHQNIKANQMAPANLNITDKFIVTVEFID